MESIFECKSDRDYMGAIGNANDKLVLAEFCADWSNPSQVLSIELEELFTRYPLIRYLRIDFNTCPVTTI